MEQWNTDGAHCDVKIFSLVVSFYSIQRKHHQSSCDLLSPLQSISRLTSCLNPESHNLFPFMTEFSRALSRHQTHFQRSSRTWLQSISPNKPSTSPPELIPSALHSAARLVMREPRFSWCLCFHAKSGFVNHGHGGLPPTARPESRIRFSKHSASCPLHFTSLHFTSLLSVSQSQAAAAAFTLCVFFSPPADLSFSSSQLWEDQRCSHGFTSLPPTSQT